MNIEEIFRILNEQCGLSKKSKILVGISGGIDSVALIDILVRLGYPVTMAHYNHHLRLESDADADFVESMAQTLKVPYIGGEGDVGALAQQKGWSLEMAARQARYHFLFSSAEQVKASAVLVGHNADDQVETILMHLLRGTGLEGLTGMKFRTMLLDFSPTIPLLRPLLRTWREEILEYCRVRGLINVEDSSNQQTIYLRNRIRNELLPCLHTYNPQIKQRLWDLSRNASDTIEIINFTLNDAIKDIVIRETEKCITISREKLCLLEHGLAILVLKSLVIRILDDGNGVNRQALLRAMKATQSRRTSSTIDLCGGVKLFLDGQRVHFTRDESEIDNHDWPCTNPGSRFIIISTPSSVDLCKGWAITADQITDNKSDKLIIYSDRNDEAWLDAEKITWPLIIRSREAGDRYQPLGMPQGSIKLSDLMINRKLPQRARRSWPLVISGQEVAWIPWFPPADNYRVTDQTQQILHLKLIQIQDS